MPHNSYAIVFLLHINEKYMKIYKMFEIITHNIPLTYSFIIIVVIILEIRHEKKDKAFPRHDILFDAQGILLGQYCPHFS